MKLRRRRENEIPEEVSYPQIDREIWKRFRIIAVKKDKSAVLLLQEVLTEYLKVEEGK